MPEHATTMYVTVTLESETCCICGIAFAMASDFRRQRREKHDGFYCPAGHQQYYTGATEAERLKAQLEAQKRDTEWQRSQRERAERQLSAARGRITKIKNRVGHGVCPCCNRSFENLARHMAGKHPEFIEQEIG